MTVDRARLQRLMDRMFGAWNAGDVEAAVACCADRIEYHDPNVDLIGREALCTYLAAMFDRWTLDIRQQDLFPLDDSDGTEGLTVCWRATFSSKADGGSAEVAGIDLVVFEGDLMVRNDVRLDQKPLAALR